MTAKQINFIYFSFIIYFCFIYSVDDIIRLYICVVVNGSYDLESFALDLAMCMPHCASKLGAKLSCTINDNHGS